MFLCLFEYEPNPPTFKGVRGKGCVDLGSSTLQQPAAPDALEEKSCTTHAVGLGPGGQGVDGPLYPVRLTHLNLSAVGRD